jgi:hypothetical protein
MITLSSKIRCRLDVRAETALKRMRPGASRPQRSVMPSFMFRAILTQVKIRNAYKNPANRARKNP